MNELILKGNQATSVVTVVVRCSVYQFNYTLCYLLTVCVDPRHVQRRQGVDSVRRAT